MLDQVLVNSLVDEIERLYLQTRAYKAAFKTLEGSAPQPDPECVLAAALADPSLKSNVHTLFASVRGQSPEQAIPALLRVLQRHRD